MKHDFAGQAASYAAFRPDYPPALFEFIATLAPQRRLAWDCGTGSGQAAVGLAGYFDRVIATDASAAQLAHARPHERVEYRLALAEESGLPDRSVDLAAVAQALHWFDLDRFYPEVRRVLTPGGALAVWSYGDPVLDDPEVDAALQRFNKETLAPYWHPGRQHVRDGYRGLPFPFAEVPALTLTLERSWTLAELSGYVRTWSAVGRSVAALGPDPVAPLEAELARRRGDPAVRHVVRWPLSVRAGTVP